MSGFLGTYAPFFSNVALVTMFVLYGVAVFGGINGRIRIIRRHCPVMTTAGLLNWVPILLYMIPRFFLSAEGRLPGVYGVAEKLPILHGSLGIITQLLITYTITHQNWIKTLPPKNPIWLMRATIIMWTLTVFGGLFIYIAMYTKLIFPASVP